MDNSVDIIYITTHAKTIMRNLLWPKGPTCPVCGSHHYTKLKDGRYYCKECSKHYITCCLNYVSCFPKMETLQMKSLYKA